MRSQQKKTKYVVVNLFNPYTTQYYDMDNFLDKSDVIFSMQIRVIVNNRI